MSALNGLNPRREAMATKKASKAAMPVTDAKGRTIYGFRPATDPNKSEALAHMALQPSVNAATVMVCYGDPLGIGAEEVGDLVASLSADVKGLWAGDMKRAEAMLFGQAHALQAIFTELSRRATGQQYIKQWEAYLRMALKAQNQCRMTLETLATIKSPPAVFARQANINNGGQQQVNNGAPIDVEVATRAAIPPVAPTELLEGADEQWLDSGAARAAGGADPQLEAVGEIDRTSKRRRQGAHVGQRLQGRAPGDSAQAGEEAERGAARAA